MIRAAALRLPADAGAVATPSADETRPRLLTDTPAGETTSAVLFAGYAFVLLICYYLLRLLREPLLLTDGSAELKSYAQAAMAVALLLLVPVYSAAFRRTSPQRLVKLVSGFFVASLCALYAARATGLDIGFAYYVWVGVFGVTMIAQFWAHAAHSFGVASGQRVFPLVMAGATLGALAGAALAKTLLPLLGVSNMLLLAAALLAATVPLIVATSRAVPSASRRRAADVQETRQAAPQDGFKLVFRDRYLLALAGLVLLLNCVSATGDFLLTKLVLEDADSRLAADPALDRSALIGAFYGDFYFAVTAATVVLQILLVGRLFHALGVARAVLVLPVIAALGYGLLAVAPLFALVHVVKLAENSVSYSIMNTARHALFLPLPTAHQYQGKTAIDGFFWRAGDLVQAGLVYASLHWLGFGVPELAALNATIAIAWLALALHVGREYRRRTATAPRRERRLAAPIAAATAALATAGVVPTTVAAGNAGVDAALFATHAPLALELRIDEAHFCRNPTRAGCTDAAGTLVYRSDDGTAVPIAVRIRSRGRWRAETGGCPLPALFIFFDPLTTAGTPFAGHSMLPLTTHCRDRAIYEEYVRAEYLAYRIYNLLSDESLRVRLATITYVSSASSVRSTTRLAFFTEHFEALAARNQARVFATSTIDLARVDAQEFGILALFQYMIGNTDWSAIYGHNTVALEDGAGSISIVPYDFDFSGLVDSEYATPPRELSIRSVRQRVFRGFCEPSPDWNELFAAFASRRKAVRELAASVPGIGAAQLERVSGYLEGFFDSLRTAGGRDRIAAACRAR